MAVALGAALPWGAARAQLLPAVHYTPESEVRALPSAEVHGVHLDREGFLWVVAYSSGLVRYDGVEMELYDEDDGLRDVALWEAVQDRAGRLWVASNEGLVVSREPLAAYGGRRRVEFVSSWAGRPLLDDAVDRNQIATDAQGRTWVGTDRLGIVRYRLGADGLDADTLSVNPSGGPSAPVRTLVVRANGSVWAGLGDGRIVWAPPGRDRFQTVVRLGEGNQSANVLYEAPDGTLWVGDREGGVWRLDEDGGGARPERVIEPLGSSVGSLRSTGRGELLVGTSGAGLAILDVAGGADAVRVYTRRNGLLSDTVHDLDVDREGTIWIAQSGGLSKLRAGYGAFAGYSARSLGAAPPLLPAAEVGAVQPGPLGGCDVWAGTAGGVACVTGAFPARSAVLTTELDGGYVNALVGDGAGRLWIGTSRGIQALLPPGADVEGATGGRAVRVNGRPYTLASFGGASVLGAAAFPLRLSDRAEPEGSVWFAAYRRVMGRVGGQWVRLDTSAGLPRSAFHAVAQDGEGRLWVGTRDRGLYRSRRPLSSADLDRWAAAPSGSVGAGRPTLDLFEPVWSSATGAPGDQVESLLWVEGEMWAATPRGLFVFEAGRGGVRAVAHLDEAAGLPSVRTFSLARSPTTGSVWVGSNGGLSEIRPADRRVVRTLTRRDGLIGNEVWFYGSVRTDADGRVYFGTASGLSVVDPAREVRVAVPPRLHLRDARVVQRPSGYNEASFRYAATSFVDEGALRYRYRLLGYDDDWSEPTADTRIRYTSLPAAFFPREYTLEAMAGTPGGVWTPEPLRVTFRVRPPWWLGIWAVLGYGVAIAAGVFTVDRLQRRRLLERERERTQLREAELEAEAARAEQVATEARARALSAEADRHAVELSKARELAAAFHQLEEAHGHLVETQAQLVQQEKMASLGRLTAGVAHELKNPLNFVTNFAQLSAELAVDLADLLRDQASGDVDAEVAEILSDLQSNAASIEAHGRRADEIVRHMLLHSRGSSGPRTRVDLNDVVTDSVGLAERGRLVSDPGAGVRVVVATEPDAVRVTVAPLEIGRVLVNLFDNAYDAVVARARTAPPGYVPTVEVEVEAGGGEARVWVRDNGAGIPDDVREQIFEPFFTTKPTGEGTGLGLSLSFDIVRQHQGSLSVAERPGGGAAFCMTLPAEAVEAVAGSPAATPRASAAPAPPV